MDNPLAVETRVLATLEERGPSTFDELAVVLFGCSCSGKITETEYERTTQAVRTLHRADQVRYTVGRSVELVEGGAR